MKIALIVLSIVCVLAVGYVLWINLKKKRWQNLEKSYQPFIGLSGFWDLEHQCFVDAKQKTYDLLAYPKIMPSLSSGEMRFIPCSILGLIDSGDWHTPMLNLHVTTHRKDFVVDRIDNNEIYLKPNEWGVDSVSISTMRGHNRNPQYRNIEPGSVVTLKVSAHSRRMKNGSYVTIDIV